MKYKLYVSALSKLTIFCAAFIVISASFMRQLFNFVITLITREQLSFMIFAGLGTLALVSLCLIFVHKSWIRIFLALIPLGLMLILAVQMPLAEERVHIFKYGLLGFLTCHDFFSSDKVRKSSLLAALVFGFSISVLDESFQALLPYRVGDIRDLAFDCSAVVAGIMLCAISKWNKN